MLGSRKSTVSVSGKTTLISSDTVILGDIRFSGVLDVEGLVQGNIVAEPGKDSLVRVIDKGRVEGEIRAPAVVINGAVEGNVHSTKHVELASRARVKGNVYYSRVEMAAGAEVNGSMAHVSDPDVAMSKNRVSGAIGAGPGDHAGGLAVASAKLD